LAWFFSQVKQKEKKNIIKAYEKWIVLTDEKIGTQK